MMYLNSNKDKEERNKEIARIQWDSWVQDSTEDGIEYDTHNESIENEES